MQPCHNALMIIPGYLDDFESLETSPLFNAMEWMSDDLFWPAFMWSIGGSETAPEAFDADPVDFDFFATEFFRPDRWPVFTLPLAGGGHLHLTGRNYQDDEGVDYLMTAPESDHAFGIAALEGHFRGPGLSWDEAIAVANQPDANCTPAERLLLLLPAMGDEDIPSTAHQTVTNAVTSVGAAQLQSEVAAELLEASQKFWGPSRWTDTDGVPVCLGTYSLRHPSVRPRSELQLIADALRGTG